LKTILKYISDFWKEDFDARVYGAVILILAFAIFFNFKYDFEDSILDSFARQPIYFALLLLYFGLAYFYVIGVYKIFGKEIAGIKEPRFWIFAFFLIAVISFKNYFWWNTTWIPKDLTRADFYFYQKLSISLKSLVIYLIGIVLFYKLVDRKPSNWYGLTKKDFNWKPYAIMLLFMVPLIAFAATQPDFLNSYPRLKMKYFSESYWPYFATYEPFYLSGFVMIEWLFRGFLVIGMVQFLGHRAVLPAATIYCVFHFGKPMGEAISSFFGGYILGIIAYYSRSIWGGIIVHMGIAFMMDIGAVIGTLFFLS